MNKTTKIWLNSLIGIAISAVLLYSIWLQLKPQLSSVRLQDIGQGATAYLGWAILLMPVNLVIEIVKWRFLASSVQPLSLGRAGKSFLAGLALSFITPNRIGEYPARILVLRMNNTIRLISVAILGAFAQFAALFLFGLAGLLYYNIAFPGNLPQVALIACLMLLLVVFLLFFYFEKWIAWFESARWLKRFRTYSQLVRRFTIQQQLTVLGLSILRFTVFTLQYLLLLRWMHIALPPADGFLMASLYFWSIAVIPSMAFTDLGVRGHVSLFLFQHFTANSLGILTATLSLWCINLLLPAVLGSLLLLKIRLIR